MQISIQNSQELDTFTKNVSAHTKLPATRLKSAIAKGMGFDHIKPFEDALDLAFAKFNDAVVAFDDALANKFNAKYVTTWGEGTIETKCIVSLLGKVSDIEVSDDGEDYEHLESEQIHIVVDSTNYKFDVEDEQIAEHDMVVFSDLMSNAASQQIPLTHERLNGNTSPVLDNVDSHVMTEFMSWLGDNVDGDSDIHFDNNGEVKSAAVLEILQEVVLINSSVNANAARIKAEHALYSKDVESETCAAAEVDFATELTMEHWENCEDTITESAERLSKSDELSKAIALLQQAGLNDVASEIATLSLTSHSLAYLKDKV
jgi:hypothetical protein